MPRIVVPMLSPPVGPVAEHQVATDVDPLARERVDFLEDRRRTDDDARRDDVHHARREDAAGNVVQLVRPLADDDRVPGVGPALIADHNIESRGQQIDQFPLGLVAPLQANDARSGHDGFSHLNACNATKRAIVRPPEAGGQGRRVAFRSAKGRTFAERKTTE